MQSIVAFLLVFIGAALCAPAPPYVQPNLYPMWDAGIETVWLDDMSFVNEISIQTYSPNNWTFYVYGDSRIRTVYPGRSWFVGATPNENWHLPFIDFHTFQNGTDVWGVGPINPLYARNRTAYSGFQFEIGIVSTKLIPDNPRGRIFVEQPLGFEGTFYSVRLWHDQNSGNTTGYFCGFFPYNISTPGNLAFGVRRAHFNNSLFGSDQAWNVSNDAWSFSSGVDDAIIFPNAQLATFNEYFKPMMIHVTNASIPNSPVNSTYLVVIDPYASYANLILGNYDPTVPLQVTGYSYIPHFNGTQTGRIASATSYQNLLFVGISVDGEGTGWIDVLNLQNLSRAASPIVLPTNFSDPRAMFYDYFDSTPTIYVGMNGGSHILKIDINSRAIVGYQALPDYLHRTWRGMATYEHAYFVTNEQHAKVYRINKADFCKTPGNFGQYCENGRWVCNQNMVQVGSRCDWKQIVVEKQIASRDKGGEIALGIFFAIATIAAIAGWYMVWKNRRGYQAVA